MLLSALVGLVFACPASPVLYDEDAVVTALAQNMKLIATGGRREGRVGLLAGWLEDEGAGVDLLLLSEARLLQPLQAGLPSFCLYTQGPGPRSGYSWEPAGERPPPGGLALAVRVRVRGSPRGLGVQAGRWFRARPTTWAEALLGRLVGYVKGWAELTVDGTSIVWSHMQASYARRPEVGAGGPGRGRAGQFEDLAEDLGRRGRPTLMTGDLNLLEGFEPVSAAVDRRIGSARQRDEHTLRSFEARTGVEFHGSYAPEGTYLGALRLEDAPTWDQGAPYDRVGVNRSFEARHPGLEVRRVEIRGGDLRVSDHLGLEIRIPFSRP